MIKVKTINIPVSKLCEVQYYIVGHPLTDAHFMPEPDFIFENRYFDTEEEAIRVKKELDKKNHWVNYEICEKIIEIFD